MKKSFLISAAVLAYCILQTAFSFSQGTAINSTGAKADSSAILDLSSTTKGILIPRMNTAQRNAIDSPAEGLQVFNTTTKCFEAFVGNSWKSVSCPTVSGCISAPSTPGNISGSSFILPCGIGNYFVPFDTNTTSYTWSYSGTGAVISGNSNAVNIYFSASATAGSLTVIAKNSCGSSSSSAGFPVSLGTPLSASAGNDKSSMCGNLVIGGSPTASGGNSYYYSYSWSPSDGLSDTAVANPVAGPTTTTVYTVMVTDANGCTATSSMTVTIGSSGSSTYYYTGGLQTFDVPAGVSCIRIEAYGAQGGGPSPNCPTKKGGYGAYVVGDFAITPGHNLSVMVGGQGGVAYGASGGGGGSFVWDVSASNLLLMAAAAGGGSGCLADGAVGSYTSTPTSTPSPGCGSGGSGGTGGNGGFNQTCSGGGGGTGWVSNGFPGGKGGCDGGTGGGVTPLGGGAGGSGSYGGAGGYGGGGGSASGTGGGGGGFNGGGGGNNPDFPGGGSGGGGGSYNGGTNTGASASGVRSGNGLIIISY